MYPLQKQFLYLDYRHSELYSHSQFILAAHLRLSHLLSSRAAFPAYQKCELSTTAWQWIIEEVEGLEI